MSRGCPGEGGGNVQGLSRGGGAIRRTVVAILVLFEMHMSYHQEL